MCKPILDKTDQLRRGVLAPEALLAPAKMGAEKTMTSYADMAKINAFFRLQEGPDKTPAELDAAVERIVLHEDGAEYRTPAATLEAQLVEKDKRIKELEEQVAVLREALQVLRESKGK